MKLFVFKRNGLIGYVMPAVLFLALACSVPVADTPAQEPIAAVVEQPTSTSSADVAAPVQTSLNIASAEPAATGGPGTTAAQLPGPATRPSESTDTQPPKVQPQVQLDADAVVAAFEQVIGRIHDDVLPSVVHIRVSQRVSTGDELPDMEFPSPFDGPPMPGPDPGDRDFFFRQGEGSGFVWSDEGYIVTNQHVVADADRLTIIFANGIEVEGEVIGEDPDSDLAVIKVDLPKEMLPPVKLGDSNSVRVGQLAIAIGNPFGQEFTTTLGIVSAIGRTLRSGNTPFSVPKVIQTDAPINPGNSGGPLLDRQGKVIGINTQIISRTGASTGIGFAVPINTARQVVPALIEDGEFTYAWLGISGTDLRREVAEAMDIDLDIRGAQIISLAPDGPAMEAGLKGSDRRQETDRGPIPVGGDVIVAVDGTATADMDGLIIYLSENTRPGDVVWIKVIRDGGEQAEIEVTLRSRP